MPRPRDIAAKATPESRSKGGQARAKKIRAQKEEERALLTEMDCIQAERLDGTSLALIEELARRFQVDEGLGVIELSLQDGRFEYAWVKQRIRKDSLTSDCERS